MCLGGPDRIYLHKCTGTGSGMKFTFLGNHNDRHRFISLLLQRSYLYWRVSSPCIFNRIPVDIFVFFFFENSQCFIVSVTGIGSVFVFIELHYTSRCDICFSIEWVSVETNKMNGQRGSVRLVCVSLYINIFCVWFICGVLFHSMWYMCMFEVRLRLYNIAFDSLVATCKII